MKVVGLELGGKLMPLQLAVGVKGGCEIGARMAQLAYDIGREGIEWGRGRGGGMCFVQIDLENACNLQACKQIFDSLHEYSPGLVRIFRKLYGHKTRFL